MPHGHPLGSFPEIYTGPLLRTFFLLRTITCITSPPTNIEFIYFLTDIIIIIGKKFIIILQQFQQQLSEKHPMYYGTCRLGRNLKDTCLRSDPECDVLSSMLDQLKEKWNSIRSLITLRLFIHV